MKQPQLCYLLLLGLCTLFTCIYEPVDSFWFTDANFQPSQAKVLPMIKSVKEKPNTSTEVPLGNLQKTLEATPNSSPASEDNKCSCSSEWFQRQLDLSIRKQFTDYFVKIADEELKKEVRAKNLSQDLFGPYKDLIPLFDRLLLLNRLQSDSTLFGSSGRVPLLRSNNEVEEIWINFRPAEAARVQQQLQPSKSNHVSLEAKSFMNQPAIIRVKHRDALFDMKNQVHDRLVLVESEQLLVINTGLGWRPLQMQPVLRDIRGELRSNEERQRLLQSSVNKARPAVDYLAKARESDATMSNYYHDRISTINGAQDSNDEQYDSDIEDDQDEEEEDDDLDDEDESDDYFTGFSLLGNGRRRSKAGSKELIAASSAVVNTVAPEQIQYSSPVISARPTTIKTPQVSLPVENRQPVILPTRRDNQQSIESRQLRMIALNEPFTGNIHGIRGADFECNKAARKAAIKGSFKAFLASGYQNLNELLRHNVRNLPIVNLRNEELANSWNDLFSKPSKLINPLSRIYSFDGRSIAADSNWPNKLVWHGAGTSSGQRHHLHQCDGWHSNSKAKFGMASPLHAPRALLGSTTISKRKMLHKRFSFTGLLNHLNKTTSSYSARVTALDSLDKYPCSMPLIVLCIETVGQSKERPASNHLDNYFDMDSKNMS